ncbi:MAG: hypothetical protein Q9M35_11305 [Rhodothermus sp.]|nr:hypothetical protein [Rhodothermus sp.]
MNRTVGLLAGLALWLSGCISLGVFQGPDVLPEGNAEVGVGLVGGGGLGMFELYGRMGVAPRLELGARTTGFLSVGAVMAEGKYQLLTTQPLVAAGMGISYSTFEFDGQSFSTIGLYPAIWIGSSRLFASARMIVVAIGAENTDEVGTGSLAGFTIGARLGRRVNLRPELTLYTPLYEGGAPVLVGGLGLSFRLGR